MQLGRKKESEVEVSIRDQLVGGLKMGEWIVFNVDKNSNFKVKEFFKKFKIFSDDGFLNVIRNGGSDHLIAPSKRVLIHTKKGVVQGVFGWPAIHVRRGADAKLTPTLENIFIDVGAKDKKEVEKIERFGLQGHFQHKLQSSENG